MLLYGAWSKQGMGDFPIGKKWNVGKKTCRWCWLQLFTNPLY